MPRLALLIITFNEETNIKACIESASFADEIIVVDSGSTDGTVAIAEELGAKVYYHKMTSFAEQRNIALENTTADWVLFLDADERISPELAQTIQDAINNPREFHGFKLPRRSYFMGRWVRGWYPDRVLRLFRREKGHYVGTVHESVQMEGPVGVFYQDIIHYPYKDIESYMNKMNKYTTMAAQQMFDRGKRATIFDVISHPLFAVIKMYLLRRSFLDGMVGFLVSMLSGTYVFLKYSKLYFLQQKNFSTKTTLTRRLT